MEILWVVDTNFLRFGLVSFSSSFIPFVPFELIVYDVHQKELKFVPLLL